MSYHIEAPFYTAILDKLTDEQKEKLAEIEKKTEGSKTVIIRTDPNRMTQKRNQVKRRYDNKRDYRRRK
jgi:hypothetical protein